MLIRKSQYSAVGLKNHEPILFTDSDIKVNNLIQSIVNRASLTFSLNWKKIENFILTKKVGNRDHRINTLFIEEEIYLKDILKIKDTSRIFENAIMGPNIRVFYLDDVDIDCLTTNFNYTQEFSKEEISFVSLFIGTKFDSDTQLILLINLLADMFLTLELRKVGVQCNRDFTADNSLIVLDDFIATPSDAHFVMEYISSIFRSIISVTNNDIVDYKYLKNNDTNISAIPLLSDETMDMIWDYELHSARDENTRSEYVNTVRQIYNDLVENSISKLISDAEE